MFENLNFVIIIESGFKYGTFHISDPTQQNSWIQPTHCHLCDDLL